MEEPKTHVFRKSCGCISGVVVDVPSMFGELSRMQRYATKHSETYELMETDTVRKMDFKCPEHKKKQESSHA